MNWVNIDLSEATINDKAIIDEANLVNKELRYFLEDELLLSGLDKWDAIQPKLKRILSNSLDINRVSEPTQIVLHSKNHTLLNLPWEELELDGINTILNNRHINISYGLHPLEESLHHEVQLPLRILLFIADPLNLPRGKRLNYEKEEEKIRSAIAGTEFEDKIEIVTTLDGTIDSLKEALNFESYHILHFIGHSNYIDGQAYLHLENPLNYWGENIQAQSFVDAIRDTKHYESLKLIYLGSCRSAQSKEHSKESLGLSQQLINAGIPAVIGMSMKIPDDIGMEFSPQFYKNIALGQFLSEAVQNAKISLIDQPSLEGMNSYYRSIPRLYLGKKIGRLLDISSRISKPVNRISLINGCAPQLSLAYNKLTFYGRRKEKLKMLVGLNQEKNIVVRGLKGVGKTALTIHVAERFQNTHDVFYYDLIDLCADNNFQNTLTNLKKIINNSQKKILYIFNVHICAQFICSDNEKLESLEKCIDEIIPNPLVQIIIIGQMTTKYSDHSDFNEVIVNHPSRNDFRLRYLECCLKSEYSKRCHGSHWEVFDMTGGNYGFLNEVIKNSEEAKMSIDSFLSNDKERTNQTINFLIKSSLLKTIQSIKPTLNKTLFYLAFHRYPVSSEALLSQPSMSNEPIEDNLKELSELGIVEKSYNNLLSDTIWDVPDCLFRIIQALDTQNKSEYTNDLDSDVAGKYFLDLLSKTNDRQYLEAVAIIALDYSSNDELLVKIAAKWINHLFGINNEGFAISQGKEIIERLGDRTPIPIFNQMAINCRKLDKFQESKYYYNQMVKFVEKQNDLEMLFTNKANYARLLSSNEYFEESIQMVHETLQDDRIHNYNKSKASLYQTLGSIYLQYKNDFDNALKYTRLAKEIDFQSKDWGALAHNCTTELEILLRLGKLPEMEELIEQSKDYAAMGTTANKWYIKFYHAKLLLLKEEKKAAIGLLKSIYKYSCRALDKDLMKETKKMLEILHRNLNIETALLDENVNHLAEYYLQENQGVKAKNILENWALPYLSEIQNVDQIITTYNNLGMSFKALQQYPFAMESLELAYNLLEQTNNLRVRSMIFENLGIVYLQLGIHDRGIKLIKKALEICQQLGQKDRYDQLLKVYKYYAFDDTMI